MSGRIVLVVLWLFFFVVQVVATMAYGHVHNADGIVLLSDEDVVLGLQRLAIANSAYLGLILLAWFTRPIPQILPLSDGQALAVAVFCSVVFNLLIVYFVARGLFLRNVDVVRDMETSHQVSLWFGFIVAPVIMYYFGLRPGVSPGK